MNVDEMDLASQALDVTPWRPESYERARTVLRGAMAEAGTLQESAPMPEVVPVRGRGFSRAGSRRRGTLGTRGKVGIGAVVGVLLVGLFIWWHHTPAQTARTAALPVVAEVRSLRGVEQVAAGPIGLLTTGGVTK